MDTLLEDGDFTPGPTGKPQPVDGVRELFQRARLRLTVPRGSFSYDAALGSRLGMLNTDAPDWGSRALAAAQEALQPIGTVTVESVRRADGTVIICCVCGEAKMEIEVKG